MESIAIVGMSCRFPGGANSPEAYWKLLCEGVDAITDVPASRFDIDSFYDPRPGIPGKIVTRQGGFLDQVDRFDPYFFALSPREAALMDPQQRLLLETAWEALEDGGQVPEHLENSRTGVFLGMSTNDYEDLMFQDAGSIRAVYVNTGGFRSVASGRLSYVLNLHGPSFTVDTACSSSLLAVHLACESLWSGACTVALAGGSNLILEPQVSIGFSQGGMLAPDGRCKFGDARADGFVRSEGVAMVVLKPLSAALSARDPIYAIIRGSAANNDGRSSGSAKLPSRKGQEAVLREAYRNAGVSPALVQYVEAHGTGTKAGDPAELEALGAVMGEGRPAGQPCRVGSAKTNVGHTEACAGMVGLLKVALSLKHRAIPPSLHLQTPNPNIAPQPALMLQRRLEPWPETAAPALAGVTSLGISATNVHVVLEEAPAGRPNQSAEPERKPHLFPISAHTPAALRELARSYCDPPPDLSYHDLCYHDLSYHDLCYTVGVRRTHHAHRGAFMARSYAELTMQLKAFLAGEPCLGVSSGESGAVRREKVVFVFPGQGSQWLGMGRQLLEQEPVFRKALEQCEEAMRPHVDWSLRSELYADPESSRLGRIDVVQPALFAIQVGLAALWRSWGVEPDAIVGHSMGEVAAAHVAGILSLEDAAKIICRRSALLRRVSGRGAMAVVDLSLEQTRQILKGFEDRLSVAVSNGPSSSVISGDPAALEHVLGILASQNVFCRPVKVDVASHSPQMDPLRGDLLEALQGLQPRPASVPMYSTVVRQGGHPSFDASYWMRNLRDCVLFWPAIEQLAGEGHDTFIELSPHPILLPAIERGVRQKGREVAVLPSLRREEEDRAVLLESLGKLYTGGYAVDFARQYPTGGRCLTGLPAYPWQRERFWFKTGTASRAVAGHPILGLSLQSAMQPGTYYWETNLTAGTLLYINDHRVRSIVVLPAASYVEMALAAAAEVFGAGAHTVEEMTFLRALVVPETGSQKVQWVMTREGPDAVRVRCFSHRAGWSQHLEGIVRLEGQSARPNAVMAAEIQARCRAGLPGDVYNVARSQGLGYGTAFRTVSQLWRGEREALGTIRLTESIAAQIGEYRIHPCLLDACYQVALFGLGPQSNRDTYLPERLDQVLYYEPPLLNGNWQAYARMRSQEEGGFAADVFLLDETGRVLIETRGLRFRRMDRHTPQLPALEVAEYEVGWQLKERTSRASDPKPGVWLILADNTGIGEALAVSLEGRGETAVLVRAEELRPDSFRQCKGVVYLWDSGAALAVTQALTSARASDAPGLWLITRGAQKAGPTQEDVAPAQAPLWGFGRVLDNEHPELRCKRIDLSPDASEIAALASELCQEDPLENEVALRGSERYVARLTRVSQPRFTAESRLAFRADGSYLITGGLGALGLEVAEWMTERGARHFVLAGRSRPSDIAQRAVEAMRKAGAEVRIAGFDVAREEQVAEALRDMAESMPPLRGVIHAAGILEDGLVREMEGQCFGRVVAPKIDGAWNLHKLTGDAPLDFFVLFSSAAALLGIPGQANYAAGNAYLDALAHHRRLHGKPALSINWGPWAEVGLAAAQSSRGDRLAARGLESLSAAQGLAALEQLMQSDAIQMAVMPFDAQQWRQWQPVGAVSSLLANLVREDSGSGASDDPVKPATLRAELMAASPGKSRLALLERHIRGQIAQVLRISPSRIDVHTPFGSLGLDSLMTLEVRNRLEASLDTTLPATIVWNYPTLATLIPYLAVQMGVVNFDAAGGPKGAPPSAAESIKISEDLTEQEAEVLLALKLAEIGQMKGRPGKGRPGNHQ